MPLQTEEAVTVHAGDAKLNVATFPSDAVGIDAKLQLPELFQLLFTAPVKKFAAMC
jgi:hypothetical protein